MIIVTGAAGFIGSNIVAEFEAAGRGPIAVCDWFETGDKWRNLAKRSPAAFVLPEDLPGFLDRHAEDIRLVIHMGAISATTERDVDRLVRLNINASVALWDWCAEHGVAFIYASSAATYGGREADFADDESLAGLKALRPLNAYGWSKKATDEIFAQRIAAGQPAPPQWVGLKFFNVYGPNEYHKGDMMSVAAKMFETVRKGEPVRLFQSYRPDISDGQQRRDFVYVKDCTRAILWFVDNPQVSGIFNIGSGRAQSFVELVEAIGAALEVPVKIEFIEMPEALRGKYQYFTEADMSKCARVGLDTRFHSVEEGVADYVRHYLSAEDRYR